MIQKMLNNTQILKSREKARFCEPVVVRNEKLFSNVRYCIEQTYLFRNYIAVTLPEQLKGQD